MSDVWKWAFDGVGGTVALAAIGWLVDRYRRRSKSSAPSDAVPPPSRFTRPTPNEIIDQIGALPPFQQKAARDTYKGLKVCWQGVFRGIDKDWSEPPSEDKPTKWVVTLMHHNPALGYAATTIYCHGISLETYPPLKFIHNNELVIVSGTVRYASYHVDLQDVLLEFPGTRING
jgi:hypothetical protein